jgi:hypothetical protein
MSLWKDLLAPKDTVVAPWTGGRALLARGRSFKINGELPVEFGWHEFDVGGGRKATWVGPADPDYDVLDQCETVTGYLVGDRLVPDSADIVVDPALIIRQSVAVHLVEAGLERFCRATAALHEGKPIFLRQEFPQGPEFEVLTAFQDRRPNVNHVAGVTPALDLSFRWQSWWREHREQVLETRRRERAEAQARLEAEQEAEEARERLRRMGGDGAARRAMAVVDFAAAAQAALGVSGAELLDYRDSPNRGEVVVQFLHEGRRFECVVSRRSLRVIDAGICLVAHDTGERGDDRFTLESLPAVITEAIRDGVLVIFRHAD